MRTLLAAAVACLSFSAASAHAQMPRPEELRAASGRGGTGPGFEISPDSRYVVSWGWEGFTSRRLADSSTTVIGPPDDCSNMSPQFRISPDSLAVLFTCSASSGAPLDLWVVPIAGPASAAVRLSLSADAPYALQEYFISDSGTQVFYSLPRVGPFRTDLYSVPVEGPADASAVINAPLGEGGTATAPVALQLSSRVLYMGRSTVTQTRDVWATDLAAANAIRIGVSPASHPLGSGFLVSADEQHIVWEAADELEDTWIYGAPVSDPPGATVQLNPDTPLYRNAGGLVMSPASDRVAYFANPAEAWKLELFSVPIAGPSSSATNLSGSAFSVEWTSSVQFSADGVWVLYLAAREVAGRTDLYRVPASGPASANLRINPVDATTVEVSWYEPIPGTTDVVFPLVTANPTPTLRCHRGSLLGTTGNATPLWLEFLPLYNFGIGCRWVVESRGVLAVADDPATGIRTLWLAHGDGPPDFRPMKLFDSTPFAPGWDPFWDPSIEATPDGRYVVYSGKLVGGEWTVWSLPLPFFWDGFESGGTAHWSALQP